MHAAGFYSQLLSKIVRGEMVLWQMLLYIPRTITTGADLSSGLQGRIWCRTPLLRSHPISSGLGPPGGRVLECRRRNNLIPLDSCPWRDSALLPQRALLSLSLFQAKIPKMGVRIRQKRTCEANLDVVFLLGQKSRHLLTQNLWSYARWIHWSELGGFCTHAIPCPSHTHKICCSLQSPCPSTAEHKSVSPSVGE